MNGGVQEHNESGHKTLALRFIRYWLVFFTTCALTSLHNLGPHKLFPTLGSLLLDKAESATIGAIVVVFLKRTKK